MPIALFRYCQYITLLMLCAFSAAAAPVPSNDDCSAAQVITIPSGGFGLGIFSSAQADLTSATVQTGETFAPAIFVAGQDKKSVWFKFSLATIRAVRVTLTQPGTTITAGDAGFAVYQTSNCLPSNADISTKLTPIVTFGNTFHPCVPSGEYLIQVSSNLNANGPIIVQVEVTDQTGAAYDHPNQAFTFGTVGYYARYVDFNTECQSIEDSTEVCSAFANPYDYNKSAWLTFKTPSYFDYIDIQLSGTSSFYYFPSSNNQNIYRTFGYHLYKGDVTSTPIGALVSVSGCDSMLSNGYNADYRMYKCGDLDTGTTYTIQIFIKKDFADDIRIGIMTGGQQPTRAPKPVLADIPAPNAIGNLPSSPAGTYGYYDDVWGCNSRHSNTNCGPALPDTGIVYNGAKYNLSSFFTFTLTNACAIYFDAYPTQCGPNPLVRVFKQGVTASCADLDTANIIGSFIRNQSIDCLQPGDYTVQVSGQDYTEWSGRFSSSTPAYNYEQCLSANLATSFRLNLTAYTRNPSNKYSLSTSGAVDTLNNVTGTIQPLSVNQSYQSQPDTLGCLNTVLPADTACNPGNGKAIYREFSVADSGLIDFSTLTMPWNATWRYRLYAGDASALATAQNIFSFPGKISGLQPKSECMDGYTSCSNRTVCITPGTYTFFTFGGDPDVGRADRPTFTFSIPKTKHNSALNAQDMGSIMDTLGPAGGTLTSDLDVWDCYDNAVPVNGYTPCNIGGKPATKAIYRQFYLKDPALVRFDVPYYWYCANRAYGYKTLFYGKATDGAAGLTPVGTGWECWQGAAGTTAGCNLLPAGWYTVISYNQGTSYDSTFRSLNLEGRYNSAVSYYDEFTITITPTCTGPKFNRPYKASVNTGNQPHQVLLANRAGHTPAFPRTDTTYVLPTENFNCIIDTPFTSHPVVSCDNTLNRVAYYVFQTTQQCFLQINAGGYYAALYNKDVRTDSLQLATLTPMQPCTNAAGYLQYCYFQPGVYTLVIFAGDANVCRSVTPSVYVDQIGYSRFDFAAKAYDFGTVPPDALYHFGKTGDVNPINALRKPSSDFFYCTTGADSSNPMDPACNTKLNPNVYQFGPNKPLYDSVFTVANGVARRNLWYTFVVDQPGYVNVHVDNKSDNRGYQPRFAVYSSDVDGTLPFNTVLSSGEIDSTSTQGLRLIGTNPIIYWPYACFSTPNEVSFYRDPCSAATTRYYILVENVNSEPYLNGGNLPNTQIEVSVMVDSVTLVLPKHDHYSQAGNIGTGLGVGVYQGDVDNYSCATRDATDPFYWYAGDGRCQKTLWYKFTPNITGNVRYRIYINGNRYQDYWQVQLFRQLIPGDSTSAGLQAQGYQGVYGSDNTYWAQTCVSPGTYYLMITGCGQLNEYVYPEIELIEAVGDFCSRAVPSAISGPGSVTSTVLVDCHTIGTDYGEFAPQLTCPQGANTSDYKTSWFRMDIGGTDTLDVTAYLVENTNASSSDIKYRMMTGDCGAMQEQSCVLDALTQNTYQCLAPGQSYYIQVFTPITKFNQQVTGTIDLRLTAVAHADTCAPLTNCLASANFTPLFDCTKDDSVKFVNYSTYGTSIRYKWFFGYNNQTSTAVSPYFFYPALPRDSTYSIKLVVENTSCGKKDSVTKTFTVPGRPFVDFGNDLASCSGSPVTLVATSHPGAVYQWSNGSADDTLKITTTGSNDYWVKVDYNGCISRDTIKVVISNIAAKPVQHIILCADSVSISASRGQGETYQWNTGATAASIFVSRPGIYWADIKYFTCNYRDSFVVSDVSTAQPLGGDTTVCLSSGGYILRATSSGAQSYLWQDGSAADTFIVTAPGNYHVTINFGSCVVKDTVSIGGYPAAVAQNTDTSICEGATLTLPWGTVVSSAGIYNDTLRYGTGCDSLVRKVTVRVNLKPNLGPDTSLCLSSTSPFVLDATVTGALSYQWQDASANATLNVTQPGLYWVQVNFGNCSTRDSITVGGSAAPDTLVTDTSICSGLSLALPWGQTVTAAGTFRHNISSVAGCDSVIQIVNLSVLPKPALGADKTGAFCPGASFDLTSQFTTTGLSSAWSTGSNAVSDPSQVNEAANYQLIATNPQGCSDTALVVLSVHPKPSLGNDSTIAICDGTHYDLNTAFNTAGLTTTWTLNTSPVVNPSFVTVGGNYQAVATNSNSCSDTAVVILTVNPKPAPGNDTLIDICKGANVDLTAVYNTTAWTSTWTINQQPVVNAAAVTDSGTYRLIVTNSNACSDTAFVRIRYKVKPALGNDTSLFACPGYSLNLTTLYPVSGLTAGWTFNTFPVATPSAVFTPGNYQLITVNSSGCSDTAIATFANHSKPALGNDTAIAVCSGRSFNLAALYNTPGLTSNWYFNNAVTPITNASAVTAAGTYTIIGANTPGCSDTATVTLAVNPKPSLGNDSSATFCTGNTVNLTTFFVTASLSTAWTINNNPVANITAVNTAGNYRLIASNAQGCSDTAFVQVTVFPKPALGTDQVMTICAGDSINLTALFNTGTNSNVWTNSGNAVNNPASVTTAGLYRLVSTNSSGCSDTALVTVTVLQPPVVVTNNQGPVCSPQTFDLTAAAVTAGSVPGLTYTYWLDTAATVAYNTPATATGGTYYIKGSNTAGCFTVKPVSLIYYPLPVPDAGADITVCNNDSAVLHVTVSNSAVPVTYSWEPVAAGGIRNPTAATTIVVPTGTQQYTVTLTDGYGCNYSTTDTLIVKMQPPVPAFAGNDTIASTGVPHQLLASGGVNYAWQPAGLLNNAGIANPLATVYADSVLFSVIVTDEAGCSGYDTVKIRTYDGFTYYIPNAFSPNGDGRNDVFRPIPVGITQTDYFRIFNRYGEVVFETNQYLKGWDGNFRGIAQPPGNYVWLLKGRNRTGKIVEMKGNVVLIR